VSLFVDRVEKSIFAHTSTIDYKVSLIVVCVEQLIFLLSSGVVPCQFYR
jgi:hypothetical protein